MDAKESRPGIVPRRKVVAAGLAALALGVVPARHADARIMLLRGMTGGGLAQFQGEEPRLANLSLFASVLLTPNGSPIVVGSLRWIEAGTGLRLQSTEVTVCRPMQERPDGAEIRGRVTVDGEGSYPFLLHAVDTGAPGSALDTLRLDVNGPDARQDADPAEGSDPDFSYEAQATLVGGDFQWIIVDSEFPE